MPASAARGGERGQALVELALVLPLLLLILFGIVDFGLGLSAKIQVTNAVRDGARQGIVYGQQVCSDPALQEQVKERVLDLAGDLVRTTIGDVEIACGSSAPGSRPEWLEVGLSCTYNFFAPGISRIVSLDCGSSISMRLE
nr:TadE-like protein [uncultured bacterium]